MTTYSKSDLATRVLRDLGIIGAEEVPSASDLTFTEETVSGEVALLAAKGISVWNGDDTSIPIEYLTPLSRRIGLAVGPAFGLFSVVEAEQAMELADKNLRRIGAIGPTGADQKAVYY